MEAMEAIQVDDHRLSLCRQWLGRNCSLSDLAINTEYY